VEPLLFRASAVDATTYAVVATTMLAAAVVASAIPAARAARVEPNIALRSG